MNVLVINRNPLLSRLIEICLSRMGYLVTLVNSFSEALEYSSQQVADVVICDTIMEDSYAEKFAKQPPTGNAGNALPIILLKNPHAHVNSVWEKCIGVRAVLASPFTTRELAFALQTALSGENIYDNSTERTSVFNP